MMFLNAFKRFSRLLSCTQIFFFLILFSFLLCANTAKARGYSAFKADFQWHEIFPSADRFGPLEGNVSSVAAYRAGKLLGYAFVASDIVASIGYSGKPIQVVVGLDLQGVIVGIKLIGHHEPILLVGIPEKKMFDFVASYVGVHVPQRIQKMSTGGALDAISGATVTAIVVDASIIQASLKVAQSRKMATFKTEPANQGATVRPIPFQAKSWKELLEEGAVRRLLLTNKHVDTAFQSMGVDAPQPFEAHGEPQETFIDLYVALVTPEIMGHNLLGEDEYKNLQKLLKPDQQAILMAAHGQYSFRGSGFVRGGIFDRFQLVHGTASLLLRDRDYKRLGKVEAEGAPTFSEVALFTLPLESHFDPVVPWRIELLAQRYINSIDKVFTRFNLNYTLPSAFIQTPPPSIETMKTQMFDEPLWQRIWRDRVMDIITLSFALLVLTWAFFFQTWVVQHPVFYRYFKNIYLTFTVVWLGFYAQAQLSVVNVLTFIHALITEFSWELFLLEPLIFILWSSIAISLLFWGRGPFCGWLCPFGGIQEILHKVAVRLGVPQINIKFFWHERLWSIKFVLFLGLLGLSFHNMAMAEFFSEVEPFKTTILLRFVRESGFILYAVLLLGIGLFINRFFCRYLCPLGAALAIPGRMRMFEWLKRRRQCGVECQICAHHCTIQAIHPEGHININECFYCLDCQKMYHDSVICPPLKKRVKRQRSRLEIKQKLRNMNVKLT